jgi:hypothetical protein
LAVDAKWAARPPLYGPGALDLSALFVKISGGRPWVAAECWRVTAIVGVVLCAWGVRRLVSLRGGDATMATVAGVFNPAVLIILVGGDHNDALMLGLTVAGIALALSNRHLWGLVLCALAVAVKPNALLPLGTLVWWLSGSDWRTRVKEAATATAVLLGVLVLCGLGTGGGFGWVKALILYRWLPSPWSLGWSAFGTRSGWPVTTIETAGVLVAVLLVIRARRPGQRIVALGWGLALLAVTTPTPEPWYLAWAVVFLAAGGLARRPERIGIAVLGAMMIGSLLPPGPLWWFAGVIVLVGLGVSAVRRPSTEDGNERSEQAESSDAPSPPVLAALTSSVSSGVRG